MVFAGPTPLTPRAFLLARIATILSALVVGYELRGLVENGAVDWAFLLSIGVAASMVYMVAFTARNRQAS